MIIATSIKAFDDDQLIVNMSLWESIEDLEAFVYKTGHAEVLRRRKEWFSKMKFYMAMWYMPAGSVPAVEEAKRRLEHLELYGASAYAFDFKQRFAPPAESLNLP